MKIGYRKAEGTLLSRCEEDYPAIMYIIQRSCTLMKIGYKKGEGILVSRCEVDYPAIMYIDEDWIQKRRGDISIKV